MLNSRQLFLQYIAQVSDIPLNIEIERAEGLYMYGNDGSRYTDLISGISVSNVGHCHPRVVQAVQRQVATYMHLMVYGELVQSPQVQLAKLLTDNLPEPLDNVYFLNSGSEAAEGALKTARRYTGRSELCYFKDSYHGSTMGSLSVMGDEYFKRAFRPLVPDTKQLIHGSFHDLEQITEKTAAVIAEPIRAESGIYVPEYDYMQALRKRCTDVGALLILDEIQTGMGRTGLLFAMQHYHIVPDILLLAKGLGGGMPIGAFISSKEIMNSLTHDPFLGHITTFGGHPVSCASAKAAMEVLLEENLAEQAEEKGQLFEQLLDHPMIVAKRRKGLMMAVEFESEVVNRRTLKKLLKAGIFSDWFLFNAKAMRIAPPLIISKKQIRESCDTILAVLDSM